MFLYEEVPGVSEVLGEVVLLYEEVPGVSEVLGEVVFLYEEVPDAFEVLSGKEVEREQWMGNVEYCWKFCG